MISPPKLAEQQDNPGAVKVEKKVLKLTHDKKLAESFQTLTKRLPQTTKAIERISSLETKNEISTQPAIELVQPAIEKKKSLTWRNCIR